MTDYSPMLAPNKYPDITNLSYPLFIQPKYDGFRATFVPDKGFITRTGKRFKNLNLPLYFSAMINCGNTVLDGELWIRGKPLSEVQSLLTTEAAKIDCDLVFVVFDAVPLEDWKNRSCDLPYSSRLKLLREKVTSVASFTKVLDISTDLVNSSAELAAIYKKHLTNGLEGAIIRSESGFYKWGRVGLTGDFFKLKPFKSVDIKVVGTFEGKGKLENTIGGIICDYNGNEVRVGTGFSMDQRNEIYSNVNQFLGKIAEIKYLEETEKSLREPRFSRWRDDK